GTRSAAFAASTPPISHTSMRSARNSLRISRHVPESNGSRLRVTSTHCAITVEKDRWDCCSGRKHSAAQRCRLVSSGMIQCLQSTRVCVFLAALFPTPRLAVGLEYSNGLFVFVRE